MIYLTIPQAFNSAYCRYFNRIGQCGFIYCSSACLLQSRGMGLYYSRHVINDSLPLQREQGHLSVLASQIGGLCFQLLGMVHCFSLHSSRAQCFGQTFVQCMARKRVAPLSLGGPIACKFILNGGGFNTNCPKSGEHFIIIEIKEEKLKCAFKTKMGKKVK